MKENIFDYLKEYGFLKEDIYQLQNINDELFFIDVSLIKKNITFFENKGLSKKEIICLMNYDPYLLTIGAKKKELLDNLYFDIFDKEELKKLIIDYPDTYQVNPLELQEVICYLKENSFDIKDIILKDKEILSKNLEEVISVK